MLSGVKEIRERDISKEEVRNKEERGQETRRNGHKTNSHFLASACMGVDHHRTKIHGKPLGEHSGRGERVRLSYILMPG